MKKIAIFVSLFLFSLSTYGGALNFKKDLDFKNKSTVYIQRNGVLYSDKELDAEKGYCQLTALSSTGEGIKAGASLPVTQIVSQVEVKKISMKLGGGASKEFELLCEMPEFPTQEKLRAIVLKNIQEDKEWTARYNKMEREEQAKALQIFMARAANQILDEEFDFIMSATAQLEF
ncbi:MAG: hypothetical protein KUG83_10065 [Gammaproteobacteria bacterium]|nr:hypothetical protein [Gammaproteobacteria bacterium]